MKRNYLHIILLALLFTGMRFSVQAQDSGWEQRTGYRYQKLLVKDLVNLHLSPNSDTIYTYNKDGFLRIRDFSSGVLLDSVRFTDDVSHKLPDICQFSNDGKTVVLAFFDSFVEGGHTEQNPNGMYPIGQRIRIYDIGSKKILFDSTLNLNELFYFQQKEQGKFEYLYPEYSYASDKNELFIKTFFMLGGLDFGLYHYTTGYLGILKIIESFIVQKKQVKDFHMFDYLVYKDSLILTCNYNDYNFQSVSEKRRPSQYWSISSFEKYTLSTNSSSKLMYNYFTSQPQTTEKLVLSVFPTSMNDTILYKSNFEYRYYDLAGNTIIPNRSIPFPYGKSTSYGVIDGIYNSKDVLVVYQDSKFYFYNLLTTRLIQSIVSPITITKFYITKNNQSLIAYNSSGEIVVLPIGSISSVRENNSESSNTTTLYPNPTSETVTVIGPEYVTSVKIINSLGMEVATQMMHNSRADINVHTWPSGVYFLQLTSPKGIVTKKIEVIH